MYQDGSPEQQLKVISEDLKEADNFMNSARELFQKVLLKEKTQDSIAGGEVNEEGKLSHLARLKNEATVSAVTNWRYSLFDRMKALIYDYNLTQNTADNAEFLDTEEKNLLNRISEKVEVIIKKHTSMPH